MNVHVSDLKEVRESFTTSNPALNGFHSDGVSNDLRAAQVHGQVMSDEVMRRPLRLDALPALGPVGKKGRKKRGSMDPW
ncbi:hypothetical protein ACOMHN_010802 [Nucella lapillus]